MDQKYAIFSRENNWNLILTS